MAQINISIAGVDTQFTLSDQDAGRILTAYTAMLSDTGPTPTPTQCVERIAQMVVTELAQRTVDWEKQQAAQQAQQNVPPLAPVVQP